jgi:toxin secretion/phage lysis holin
MEKVWDKTVRGLAACGGAIAGMMGGWDPLLRVLITLMAADYVTGLLVAMMGKSTKTEYGGLSSKVGAIGLARKGLMLMVVLVAALMDSVMGTGSAMCRDAACWFYIANEGISILENAGLAGAPYPTKLKELLGQKQKEDAEHDIDA